MPPAPSEPEKYSIDEMMERLKTAPTDGQQNGQLVTREDGSQAIKVRKRKRRSSQSPKGDDNSLRRARILQVSGALVLLFTAALAVGSAVIYANSSPFREKLLRDVGNASGAQVDLQQFRMNPRTANAGQLLLNWPQGNILKRLNVSQLSAEIFPSSFLGKSLNGEEIIVNAATLNLQIPKAGDPLTYDSADRGDSAINFNRYRARALNVTVGDEAAPVISLLQSEGSLTPRNLNGRSHLSLYQGSLGIANWPKFRLDRALIEFHGAETDIIGLRILNEKDDRGSFELSGTIFPYRPQQPSSLAVRLDSFDLTGLIGPELGRFFSGRVDSPPAAKSNYLSFMPSGNPTPRLEITYRAASTSHLEIHGLPFLSALSQILEYKWFEQPIFDPNSSGCISRQADTVTLHDLKLESKGHLMVQGEISSTKDQTLTGNLRIGVADGIIATSKNIRLKAIFGEPVDGFCWMTLQLGGSAAAPTDTFKSLFAATTSPSEATTPAKKSGSSFRELTRPK